MSGRSAYRSRRPDRRYGGFIMAQLSERQVSDLDLMHYGIFVEGRAHEIWRRLRAEAPVFWNPGNTGLPGFWSITKYADLIAVSRDTETFISSRGITMSNDPATPPPGAGKSMITMDPPRHVRLRRLVNKG